MIQQCWHISRKDKNSYLKRYMQHSVHSSTICNSQHMEAMWVSINRYIDKEDWYMAIHSSILPWRIPWTEKPGRLQSMESQRVRHDWVTKQQQHTLSHWKTQRNKAEIWVLNLQKWKLKLRKANCPVQSHSVTE